MKNQEIEWLLWEKYHGEKTTGFFTDCQRLEAGEPLGHVIGYVPFLDCQIWLDSRPLIPRTETESWVEEVIKQIHQLAKGSPPQARGGEPFASTDSGRLHVLDLCAGSGAIGVAIAKAIPEASVTFGEIDETHLPTIKKNLEVNTIIYDSVSEKRFTVVQSDLFENIDGLFDFILTNPPYIDKEAKTVDSSVVEHEPHLALFGGEDGMEIIDKIVVGARAKLAPQGQLWIEHEPAQVDLIAQSAKANNFSITTHPDQYGTPRYSVLIMAK